MNNKQPKENPYGPLVRPKCLELNLEHFSRFSRRLDSSPLLFHGVNKSGSLAMSRVLHLAYDHAGHSERFLCRYMQIPPGRTEALQKFEASLSTNPILIDHGVVGLEKKFPTAKVATMIRNPVRRMVSIYYWLLTHHPEKVVGRDILSWLEQDGRQYSQVRQFAFDNSSPSEAHLLDREPVGSMVAAAATYFDEHVSWFGVCELFEETIVSLCLELGLAVIPAWQQDERNEHRPVYDRLPRKLEDRICEIMGYDIAFYELKKREFVKYIERANINESIKAYSEMVV